MLLNTRKKRNFTRLFIGAEINVWFIVRKMMKSGNSTVRKFAAAKKFISIRSQLVERFSKGEKIFQSEQDKVFASSFFPEDEEDNLNVVMLLDLNYIRQSTSELTNSFTPNFLHTFAAKANPIPVSPFSFLFYYFY